MKVILINLKSNSLGDTIGVMPCIEKFISNTNDTVLFKSNPKFKSLFTKSYPNIKFFEEDMTYDKVIDLAYNFNLPLQTGFAQQLGFMDWSYIRPKVDIMESIRPIKNKFVTISVHSTSQLKYFGKGI